VLDVTPEDGGRLSDVTPKEKNDGAYTRHRQHEIRQPHDAFASHSARRSAGKGSVGFLISMGELVWLLRRTT